MPYDKLRELSLKKYQELGKRFKQHESLPSDFNTAKLLSKIILNTENVPNNQLELITRKGLDSTIDDAVIKDPIGSMLYQIGWKEIKPSYAAGEKFINEAKKRWEELGESSQIRFKKNLMGVSDEKMFNYLRNATEEQLFKIYFDVEVLYHEKIEADFAMLRMCARKMKEQEYNSWANKFGIFIH